MLFSLGAHGWCASLSLSELWECLVLPLRCCYLADGSSWELLQQHWGGDTATHVSHLGTGASPGSTAVCEVPGTER